MKKRKYTLRRRAAQQAATRERIVDAAIALHEELGPAATTISALAERAGVQRLTVYRHFPQEEDVLAACSSKWFGLHQPPDPSVIDIGDPTDRTSAILLALFRYYETTRKMWTSVYRDADRVPALNGALRSFDDYLARVGNELLRAQTPARSKALRATVEHVIRFSTWQSLHRLGLKARGMAELVTSWILAARDGGPARPERKTRSPASD